LSKDRRNVRFACPPMPLAGLPEPLRLFLDFDVNSVDELIERLTVPRAQMLPPHRNRQAQLIGTFPGPSIGPIRTLCGQLSRSEPASKSSEDVLAGGQVPGNRLVVHRCRRGTAWLSEPA